MEVKKMSMVQHGHEHELAADYFYTCWDRLHVTRVTKITLSMYLVLFITCVIAISISTGVKMAQTEPIDTLWHRWLIVAAFCLAIVADGIAWLALIKQMSLLLAPMALAMALCLFGTFVITMPLYNDAAADEIRPTLLTVLIGTGLIAAAAIQVLCLAILLRTAGYFNSIVQMKADVENIERAAHFDTNLTEIMPDARAVY